MTLQRSVLFRLDAGRALGLGHGLRCFALAHALARMGWSCRFAVNPGAEALLRDIADVPWAFIEDDAFADPSAMPTSYQDALKAADLLIVDHYRLDADYECACRALVDRVLVVDDLVDRTHAADLIVDTTYGRTAGAYAALAPGTPCLAGAAYALLAPAFPAARAGALARRAKAGPARNVLVTLGGAPPEELLERLGRIARRAVPDAEIHIAAGGSDAPALRGEPGVVIHRGRVDMAALTAKADLAFAAGGSSAWERCCLGLPTVLVEIADNQRDVARSLAEAGVVVRAGVLDAASDATLIEAVRTVASDPVYVAEMARRAALICDGLGAARAANAAAALFDGRAPRVTLRPATRADGGAMLAWQSELGARRFAKTPRVPAPDEHFAWLDRRLADPLAGPFEIIEADGAPAGVLRFDREADGAYRISILVAAAHQGRGVAARALRAGGRLLVDAELRAEVLAGNDASHRLFQAAGYVRTADEEYRRGPL